MNDATKETDSMQKRAVRLTWSVAAAAALLCSPSRQSAGAEEKGERAAASAADLACDPRNGDITLPDGFCALVFADNLGAARHLAITESGDVYVSMSRGKAAIVALRDTDGDGRADVKEEFGDHFGTGIGLHDGYLYESDNRSVVRYRMSPGKLTPEGAFEKVIEGFPEQRAHNAKSFAFDDQGHIFVNVGAPSNACQVKDRVRGEPGQSPCPQREWQASIWKFDAGKLGQTQRDNGTRYSSGIRNSVAIAWDPASKSVYVVQHGRDQLHTVAPEHFDDKDNAEAPAEEFLKLSDGADFMWPYCYFDPRNGKKLLAPEYGGDGQKVGDCDHAPRPLVAFPGHWGPNDLLFYTGTRFPEKYRGGAFVAFHGSWNRAPLPQGGYNVVFVPMRNGEPAGDWKVFADGFKGKDPLDRPNDARFRPTGLSQGPDGSLYIADSEKGRIWRVIYRGGMS
jgi:glucose/arabinose dehydrogenase